MIINGILSIILNFLTGLFVLVPTFPAIDPSIASAGTWITNFLSEGVAFAQFIFGVTFYDAVIAVAVAIWAFEPVYHSLMWVLRKIPILSIK